MKALFPGRNEKDQLDKIFKVNYFQNNSSQNEHSLSKIFFFLKDLGTPTDNIWPGWRDLPLAKNLKFPEFPYNTLRSRFGTYLSDKGLNLINA
jgi:cell division cycle 2-like protein